MKWIVLFATIVISLAMVSCLCSCHQHWEMIHFEQKGMEDLPYKPVLSDNTLDPYRVNGVVFGAGIVGSDREPYRFTIGAYAMAELVHVAVDSVKLTDSDGSILASMDYRRDMPSWSISRMPGMFDGGFNVGDDIPKASLPDPSDAASELSVHLSVDVNGTKKQLIYKLTPFTRTHRVSVW